MFKIFYRFFLFFSAIFFVNCSVPITPMSSRSPLEQSLSLTDPLFKNCIFQPQTRIAHFPMYHFPPDKNYDAALREKVVKSQFQLLHTILTYFPNVAVFDENVTANVFGPKVFQALQQGLGGDSHYERADGQVFHMQERYNTAQNLFHADIPMYYDRMGEIQKEYIFQTGGSMTLYFLGHIRQLHKVIDLDEFQIILRQIEKYGGVEKFLRSVSTDSNSRYYIYGFREERLKFQVETFFNINPSFHGISLVAYGADHDFRDDFTGYYFEEGRHCLQWDTGKQNSQTIRAFSPSLFFRL